MRYPSCYVLVCDSEDIHSSNSVLQPMHNSSIHASSRLFGRHGSGYPHLSPPASPSDPLFGPIDHHGMKVGSLNAGNIDHVPSIPGAKADVLGYQLAEKVRQDACLSINTNKRLSESNNLEESQSQQPSVGTWNFTDPASRVNCNCVKHRKKAQGKGAVGGKHGKGIKPEDRPRHHSQRSSVPFHRRSPQTDDLLQFDVEGMMAHSLPQANPAFIPTGATTIVNSNNTTPQGGRSTPMHDSMLPVDTPNSAPSPLDEPQPPASSTMDPTMPTLSPHPPSKLDNNRSTPGGGSNSDQGQVTNAPTNGVGLSNGSNINVSISNLPGSTSVSNICSNNNFVPNTNSGLTVSGGGIKEELGVAAKSGVTVEGSETQFSWSSTTTKTESISHWVHSHQQQRLESNLKRPHLPTKGSDCDSHQPVDSLYNFDSLNSW